MMDGQHGDSPKSVPQDSYPRQWRISRGAWSCQPDAGKSRRQEDKAYYPDFIDGIISSG
jgi:hypothetical protein